MDSIKENYSVKLFEQHDEQWLDFIISCRSGKANEAYDVVIGGIADDRIYDTIELYFDSLIDKQEAVKRLMYYKPNNQICIRNQEVIDKYLWFVSNEVVKFDGE